MLLTRLMDASNIHQKVRALSDHPLSPNSSLHPLNSLSIGTGPDKLRILPPPVRWMFNTKSILMPILPREDVDYYRIGRDGKYVLSTVRKKKFEGASPFSKKFHSTQCLLPNDDNLCTYVVVTDENNKPYPIESLRHIAPPLKGNLLIPCLSDSIDRKQWRRFFSMSHTSYRQLLKCIPNGISTPLESDEPDAVSLFDALVECLSSASVTLFCPNDHEFGNTICKNAVIYAGECAPPLTPVSTQDEDEIPSVGDWNAFRTPVCHDVLHDVHPGIVRHMTNSSGMFKDHPALSTSFISKVFHGRMISQDDVDVVKHAYGTNGSYKNRQGSVGFNAYPISVRNDEVATHVSPNCGPGHLSRCTYHLHTGCDVRYMPAVHAITKIQNESIMATTKSFYRHIRCSSVLSRGDSTNDQEFHSIMTINFGNQPHYDKYDNDATTTDAVIGELEQMKGSKHEKEAEYLTKMVDEFRNPLPTTCCYQHVKLDWREVERVQIHSYFPFPSIGVVLRLHHMTSHVFLASVISHCTSPPIFIESASGIINVRIGSHPRHSLVAWGGKKKKKD